MCLRMTQTASSCLPHPKQEHEGSRVSKPTNPYRLLEGVVLKQSLQWLKLLLSLVSSNSRTITLSLQRARQSARCFSKAFQAMPRGCRVQAALQKQCWPQSQTAVPMRNQSSNNQQQQQQQHAHLKKRGVKLLLPMLLHHQRQLPQPYHSHHTVASAALHGLESASEAWQVKMKLPHQAHVISLHHLSYSRRTWQPLTGSHQKLSRLLQSLSNRMVV